MFLLVGGFAALQKEDLYKNISQYLNLDDKSIGGQSILGCPPFIVWSVLD